VPSNTTLSSRIDFPIFSNHIVSIEKKNESNSSLWTSKFELWWSGLGYKYHLSTGLFLQIIVNDGCRLMLNCIVLLNLLFTPHSNIFLSPWDVCISLEWGSSSLYQWHASTQGVPRSLNSSCPSALWESCVCLSWATSCCLRWF